MRPTDRPIIVLSLAIIAALAAGAVVPRSAPAAPEDAVPDAAREHLAAGREHFERGRLVAAKTELEAATGLAPGLVDGWYLLGLVFTRGERYGRAVEAFERGLAEAPAAPTTGPDRTRGKLRYSLGIAQLRRGDDAAAEKALRGALAADDGLAPARVELGVLLGRRAAAPALEEAERLLTAASDADEDDARAAYELGVVAARRGDDAGSVAAWRRCLAANEGHLEARYALGRALLRTGETREGRATLAEWTRREKKDRAGRRAARARRKASEMLERASLAIADGEPAAAIPYVERALQLAPDDARVQRGAAELWTRLGRDDRAAAAAAEAARLENHR